MCDLIDSIMVCESNPRCLVRHVCVAAWDGIVNERNATTVLCDDPVVWLDGVMIEKPLMTRTPPIIK